MDLLKKILIVDDEVLIAESLKDMLVSLGYKNVFLSHSKQEAVKTITDIQPQLILLDIRMNEELEGIDLAHEINLNYHIPFLFITAHADSVIIKKALETGPVGYLTKPFKKMDVFAAINLAFKLNPEVIQKTLTVKDGYDTLIIPLTDIIYVRADGNYIEIVTNLKKHALRYSLDWFLQNVPNFQFKRIHRSYIVNAEKVEK